MTARLATSAVTAPARRTARGFTLIELLVVLFIIGVTLTFATLSVTDRAAGDRLQREARRLHSLLDLASEQAVIYGVELGLDLTPHGYRFLRLDSDGWRPITDSDSPLRPRKLDDNMTLRLVQTKGEDYKLGGDQNDEDEDDEHKDGPRPEAMFLSSGEITPFELELRSDGTRDRYRYTGKLTGELEMEMETGQAG